MMKTTFLRVAVLTLALGACGKTKPGGGTGTATGGSGTATGGAGGSAQTGGAGGTGAGGNGGTAGNAQKLVILHTNDLHSHLMGHAPEADYTPATPNDDMTRGGFARLAAAVGAAKTEAAGAGTPVLLLDAGDFMMGTLFELLATAKAPELKLMAAMGYDATTLGNHEFDWTPKGLAGILAAAAAENVSLPIVASNMNFSASDAGDDELKMLADMGLIRTKLVKTVGGLKVGFFGLLGADAVQVTPTVKPLTFDPIATAAARMVTELRETDKVDLVIALSHSGISSTGVGEDEKLAKAVTGIDIIISGHTHDTLAQPVKIGETLIVTAGSYGQNLGNLRLTVTPSATPGGRASVVVDGYVLRNIDDTITGDASTQAAVDAYIGGLDTALTPLGLTYRKAIGETAADLTVPAFAESPLGNLVTDSYLKLSAALQATEPPVIAVEGNGQLRSPILKGKTGQIWFADLFRVLPLGIGPDGKPGFPLVTYYLHAKDLRSGLELGGAPEVVDGQYFLQVAGLQVEYDMTKPLFGRVSGLKLVPSTGAPETLDLLNTTRCFKIVSTNYVAGLLGVVKTLTGGLLSVDAKAADCTTLVDPTVRFVDADPAATGVQELKHWQAFLKYLTAFPDGDADTVADVPAPYLTAQGRITKK